MSHHFMYVSNLQGFIPLTTRAGSFHYNETWNFYLISFGNKGYKNTGRIVQFTTDFYVMKCCKFCYNQHWSAQKDFALISSFPVLTYLIHKRTTTSISNKSPKYVDIKIRHLAKPLVFSLNDTKSYTFFPSQGHKKGVGTWYSFSIENSL